MREVVIRTRAAKRTRVPTEAYSQGDSGNGQQSQQQEEDNGNEQFQERLAQFQVPTWRSYTFDIVNVISLRQEIGHI